MHHAADLRPRAQDVAVEAPLGRRRERSFIAAVVGIERHRHDVVRRRSDEHPSELQSLLRPSYAVFRLKHKNPKSDPIPTPVNISHDFLSYPTNPKTRPH